jgi:hypothetical protein
MLKDATPVTPCFPCRLVLEGTSLSFSHDLVVRARKHFWVVIIDLSSSLNIPLHHFARTYVLEISCWLHLQSSHETASTMSTTTAAAMAETLIRPKRVLVPIANGSCEYQAISIVTCLGKCGIQVILASINGDQNCRVNMIFSTVCLCRMNDRLSISDSYSLNQPIL